MNEEEKQIIDQVPSADKKNDSNQTTYFRGDQMLNLNIPTVPYIVEGYVRQGSLTLLAGEEGCGKSILVLNLGISVACGLDNFLGHNVSKPGIVLFLNNELSFPDHLERFKKNVLALSKIVPANLNNFVCPDSFPPFPEYAKELEGKIIETSPILVILDCLYWAHDKKENDSSEMKALMRQLDHLRKKYEVAIVVVHHTKKGARNGKMQNDDLRGSGVFGAVADQIIQIRRSAKDESLRLIKMTKSRHGIDHLRRVHLLSLDTNTLWFIDKGEAVEEEHLPILAQPKRSSEQYDFQRIYDGDLILSREEILQRNSSFGANVASRTIDRYIKNAVSKGVLLPKGYGKYVLTDNQNKEEGQDVGGSIVPPSVEGLSDPV